MNDHSFILIQSKAVNDHKYLPLDTAETGMPRPPLFDETEVINQSMKLFWKQGYVATGISQILQTVALKPGSFYNVFPSKKDLFVRSLTHYQHHIVAGRIAKHLDNKENPLDAIESFFSFVLRKCPQK